MMGIIHGALAASWVIDVQTCAETDDSVTFGVTVDFKLDRQTFAAVESIAA
jgi:hypothetical protein